jgi:hypothetical protein
VNWLFLYSILGAFVTLEYWLIWTGPIHLRHWVLWPILVTCQVARVAPPQWMKPAPADVAAQAADGWTRD